MPQTSPPRTSSTAAERGTRAGRPEAVSLARSLGPVQIDSPAVLAPLAGYTDTAMRRLCRKSGAGMVFSEMLSGEGTRRSGEKTLKMAAFDPEERPYSIQYFATDPEQAADAARILCTMEPDGIDLNFGCPVKKVILNQGGSALLKDVSLLAEIVAAAVRVANVPVSVKIRSGWDRRSLNAVEVAQAVEEAGAAWISVHARTRSEFFRGRAHWEWIGEVKDNVRIPIVGNGDVRTPEDAIELMKVSGCDAVMIGRAAMGYPFIFREVNRLLETGDPGPAPTPMERFEAARQQLEWMVEHRDEVRAVREFRKHLILYVRGLHGCSRFKMRAVQLEEKEAVIDAMREFCSSLPDEPTARPISAVENAPTWC